MSRSVLGTEVDKDRTKKRTELDIQDFRLVCDHFVAFIRVQYFVLREFNIFSLMNSQFKSPPSVNLAHRDARITDSLFI